MDFWTLLGLTDEEAAKRFPATRRFFANGFKLNSQFHGDNTLGLSSPNQSIQLNIITGDFQCLLS